MKRLALVGAAALVLGGLLLATQTRSSAGERTLVLTGSSTVAPLAAEIAKRFEALHPGTRVDVQTGGSSRGIADARRGLADVGMVSRALKESEQDLLAHPIARDGICMIVHESNRVPTLTREQVIAIYTGKTERWSEVGGEGEGTITVVHKAAGRSTHELFLQHFGLKAREVQPDVVIGDNEQGIKTVAGNPLAVGYVSVGTAEYDAANGTPIRLLPAGGVAASSATVRDGTYPLLRVLNLVTKGPPKGLAAEFLAFAQSEAVADLIQAQAFVPLTAQ